jgi:hypothetical protein
MIESLSGMSLEEFKHQVKMWMEIDNQIKSAMAIVKSEVSISWVLMAT